MKKSKSKNVTENSNELNLVEQWLHDKNDMSSLFLTGNAGTGKSTLINQLRANNKDLNIVTLAPTGVSAKNIDGITIHSFFQMPNSSEVTKGYFFSKFNHEIRQREINAIDLIIIDECSMIRADMLDRIDFCLKTATQNKQPFGGKKILFVGDLYQLPPILENSYKETYYSSYDGLFFFNSKVFEQQPFKLIKLETVYRQSDLAFIEILNKIRVGKISATELNEINKRCLQKLNDEERKKIMIISATNKVVDNYNSIMYEDIESEEFIYTGEVEGKFPEKEMSTALELKLKVGCQVMFVNNDYNKLWQNGTIGTIKELSADCVTVQLSCDMTVVVSRHTFLNTQVINSKLTEIGSFTQIPLKYAWAITIHKSQGLTFDNVILDTGNGIFVPGQLYVAMSRCRSLQGLELVNSIKLREVIVNVELYNYEKRFEYLKLVA